MGGAAPLALVRADGEERNPALSSSPLAAQGLFIIQLLLAITWNADSD